MRFVSTYFCYMCFKIYLDLFLHCICFLECNQYYCNCSLYINYIYSIICHGISFKKKLLATWGLEPASLVSVNTRQTWYALDHYTSPKKDASSPELSNTIFPIRPNDGIVFTFRLLKDFFLRKWVYRYIYRKSVSVYQLLYWYVWQTIPY